MNILAKEHSPYLKSAAHQPVSWLPWGEDAFRKAREEQKPILLDIGAVWCHWCHVMDMESYENEAIARLINDKFVAIKVDRDERPDVDARYQAAVSALTGQGGWPLTAFLLPDGRVFYGGTYFPPDDRFGRPGFSRILLALADAYHQEPGKATESAERVSEFLHSVLGKSAEPADLSESILEGALSAISHSYDVRYGGFGDAPKFPHPATVELLLARHHRTGEQWMIDAVNKTLTSMSRGGICDQIGGGFHRYSTDERWIVPHFEKMLHDNAPLLTNYLHAFQATRDSHFRDVARGIIRFTNAVLADRDRGGFFASQDADVTFGDDGSYFTWSMADAQKVLTPDEFAAVQERFHVTEKGEMHHDQSQNVLFVDKTTEEIAVLLKKSEIEIQASLDSAVAKLGTARERRHAPFVDKTIYASWNGMMVRAFLEAYKVLEDESARAFGLKTLRCLLRDHRRPDGLLSHRPAIDSADGFLDDQMEVALACLAALEITGEVPFLVEAERIVRLSIEFFWDSSAAAFHDIPHSAVRIGSLTVPHKPVQDSPTPGGNAVAVLVLNRLFILTGDKEYRRRAEETLRFFAGNVKNHGTFAATYFLALEEFLNPPPHVVVVSHPDDLLGQRMFRSALESYSPGKTVQLVDPNAALQLPAISQSKTSLGGFPVGLVCSQFACGLPVRSESELAETIRTFRVGAEVMT